MGDIPRPKDLRGAAGVAQSLAYAVGLAGIVAGGLLYREGDLAFAVVALVLTFAVGAMLIIAAQLARGMAALLARLARIEQDVAQVVADRPPQDQPRDPWGHQPPY